MFGVDGLRNIIRSSGFQALLAVALHRFGGHGNNRNRFEFRNLANLLHRDVADLSETQKNMMMRVNRVDPRLEGKKVLIVDDDIRNIFALTSALERQQMQVVYAENGRDAIETLKKTQGIEGVLMDIMMPEMDGYEAMNEIRNISKFKSIPIIAVTAKAMKGDRQKCIEAGASDYITKPVETEQLLSLLRIWLDR